MAEDTRSALDNSPRPTSEEETAKQQSRELAAKWLKAIAKRRNAESKWREKGKKVISRYRDDRDVIDEQATKFNILWANTEVLKPAIFARMPVPDVRRRYLTSDPIARTASMILERGLSYCMDSYDFKDTLDRAEEDYLLPGRGQVRVCYKPYFKQARTNVEPLPPDEEDKDKDPPAPVKYPEGTQIDDQGAYQMQEEKLYEEVYSEYQDWDLYVFGKAKQRCKVPWEAYGDRMSKDEVREEYPEFKDWDKLTYKAEKGDYSDSEDKQQTVTVWQVWDKTHRKMMVFAEGYTESPLKPPADDSLGLENFYPSPEPLYSIRTNGDDCPKPEFLMYQDQANELDILVNRQRALTQALKYRGLYDKRFDTEDFKLSSLTNAPDNTFLPAPGFAEMVEKGGFESVIASLPLEEIAKVLSWLAGRIEILKQEIYEIYGISDIVRGTTKASETLGAQQLKAQYAGMRISTRQERFQRFIRDILRIKAEIIAEHFSPQTLQVMTGLEVVPDEAYAQMKQAGEVPPNTVAQSEFMQACALIKSDKLRGFRVDIETDSTVPVDKDTEQQNRVQFMQAIGQYLQGVLPAVQEGMIPIKLAREGLLFVVRGFKVGTELEATLEELGANAEEAQQMQQMKQVQAQMQEQLQQAQEQNQQLQQDNQKLQSNAQAKAQEAQAKAQTEQWSAQQSAALENQQAGFNAQLAEREAANNAALAQAEANHAAQLEQAKAERQALIEGQKAAQEAAIREREALLDARIKTMEAQLQQRQADQAERKEKAGGEGDSMAGVHKAIEALTEHATKPRVRKGKAKLPSGGVMEFEMQDS